jgi:uncharacterized membrane protein
VAAFFFFLVVAFFRAGDGDGEAVVAVAVVAVVDVAPVSCFCAQETINASAARAVIKDKTDFFIVLVTLTAGECSAAAKSASK